MGPFLNSERGLYALVPRRLTSAETSDARETVTKRPLSILATDFLSSVEPMVFHVVGHVFAFLLVVGTLGLAALLITRIAKVIFGVSWPSGTSRSHRSGLTRSLPSVFRHFTQLASLLVASMVGLVGGAFSAGAAHAGAGSWFGVCCARARPRRDLGVAREAESRLAFENRSLVAVNARLGTTLMRFLL